MPSKTKKQAKFMAAVANSPKFAKKAGVPQSVGRDFANADKGKTFKEGGMPNFFDSTKNKPGKGKMKYAGGGMAHDKRVLRNLDDEDYRIRNRTGSNTDAERRRINREKDFEKNRMGGMAAGGKVKKEGYNARLDDSMGARSGKKSQSETARRNESEGMEKAMGRRKFAGAGTMDVGSKKMAVGGKVGKSSASSRADGIARRGKTRGRIV
jgi:hypothetical protein